MLTVSKMFKFLSIPKSVHQPIPTHVNRENPIQNMAIFKINQ